MLLESLVVGLLLEVILLVVVGLLELVVVGLLLEVTLLVVVGLHELLVVGLLVVVGLLIMRLQSSSLHSDEVSWTFL